MDGTTRHGIGLIGKLIQQVSRGPRGLTRPQTLTTQSPQVPIICDTKLSSKHSASNNWTYICGHNLTQAQRAQPYPTIQLKLFCHFGLLLSTAASHVPHVYGKSQKTFRQVKFVLVLKAFSLQVTQNPLPPHGNGNNSVGLSLSPGIHFTSNLSPSLSKSI